MNRLDDGNRSDEQSIHFHLGIMNVQKPIFIFELFIKVSDDLMA